MDEPGIQRTRGQLPRRHIRPQIANLQLDRVERLDARRLLIFPNADGEPVRALAPESLERSRCRVDDPRVPHPLTRVDRQFLSTVEFGRAGRNHLAHPIGSEDEFVRSPRTAV